MPFEIERFIAKRPVLYHLTARANLAGIEARGELLSARELMLRARDLSALRTRREEALALVDRGEHVATLRDQKPLHEGNVALEGSWTFADLVEALNRRVFFWPGTQVRPIDYAIRHFQRYLCDDPVVIRLGTAELFELNPMPEFCRCNSGSPRCSAGRKSRRGPETFVGAAAHRGSVGDVVEVTFEGRAALPHRFEVLPASAFAPARA